MVFPGRLSTGCHVCRRRKVKCDGTKPECHRCSQHGVKCTGYPDRFSFREYKPPEESRGPKKVSPRRRSPVSDESQPIAHTQPTSHKARPVAAIPLSADWQSLCSFMNRIVLPVHRSPCEGHLAFLPKLYRERSDDACLKHAILSVSYLTLSREHKSHKLDIQARRNHGISLGLLKTALESQDSVIKDETLTACLLLSMYYSLTQDEIGLPDPHMSGVFHLLRLRGKQQLQGKYGRQLIGWMMMQTQLQAIKSNHFEYAELPSFIQTLPKPCNVFRAGIVNSKISRFCQSATAVCNAARTHNPSSESIISLYSLIEHSEVLIEDIEAWHSCIPGHWKRQYRPEHREDPERVSPDPWTTIFLAITHSTQIIFYQQVLTCIDIIEDLDPGLHGWPLEVQPLEYRLQIESRIRYLINIICFTVRFNLGEADPKVQSSIRFANNTLYWPMQVIVDCPLSTTAERRLCQNALQYIRPPTHSRMSHSMGKEITLSNNPTT